MDFNSDDDDEEQEVYEEEAPPVNAPYPLSHLTPPRVVLGYATTFLFSDRTDLNKDETAAYKAALRTIRNYLDGEQSYS